MRNELKEVTKTYTKKMLSNIELIAFAIGTGSKSDLQTAEALYNSCNKNLNNLAECTINELSMFKGMTEGKALRLAACFELGIRRESTPIDQKPFIGQSSDAYSVLIPYLMDLPHEEFLFLMLNQANKVIGVKQLSKGGVNSTTVDVKGIYKEVVSNPRCTSIILAHNHPSGNLEPSSNDIKVTAKVKEAGKYLDIAVLDHIIIAGNQYTSLADKGLM